MDKPALHLQGKNALSPDPYRKLSNPRVSRRTGNAPEGGRSKRSARLRERRRVRHIEQLCTELHVRLLSDSRMLHQRQICISIRRPAYWVARGVPEGKLRRRLKCSRIEEALR